MALFSTTYFGNIYYYALAWASGQMSIESHENFVKQSYRNRCSIVTANGAIDLIVPVIKCSGTKSKIDEVKIDYSTRWQSIHERGIVSAYKNAPYFDHYYPLFEQILKSKYDTLFELNNVALKAVEKSLKISLNTTFTEHFTQVGESDTDYRYSISPKIKIDKDIFKPYYQVFSEKMDFVENLSILDLIFCEGPGAIDYLKNIRNH